MDNSLKKVNPFSLIYKNSYIFIYIFIIIINIYINKTKGKELLYKNNLNRY
jgi:hypothetical protein